MGKGAREREKRRMAVNGDAHPGIPEDLVWDDENPPEVFNCSNHLYHERGCDGTCGLMDLTESKVALINEGLAYARAGMEWRGLPAIFAGKMPINGMQVELTDVLMWLETLKKTVCELAGISEDEFDEMFRANKIEMLRSVREANEERLRKSRLKSQLGVVENPLLGPDGFPIK